MNCCWFVSDSWWIRTKMEMVVNGIRNSTNKQDGVDDGGSRRVLAIKVLGLVSANQTRGLDRGSIAFGQVLVEADKLTHTGSILLGTGSGSAGGEIWWDQSLGRVSATQNGAHVVCAMDRASWTVPQPLVVSKKN